MSKLIEEINLIDLPNPKVSPKLWRNSKLISTSENPCPVNLRPPIRFICGISTLFLISESSFGFRNSKRIFASIFLDANFFSLAMSFARRIWCRFFSRSSYFRLISKSLMIDKCCRRRSFSYNERQVSFAFKLSFYTVHTSCFLRWSSIFWRAASSSFLRRASWCKILFCSLSLRCCSYFSHLSTSLECLD